MVSGKAKFDGRRMDMKLSLKKAILVYTDHFPGIIYLRKWPSVCNSLAANKGCLARKRFCFKDRRLKTLQLLPAQFGLVDPSGEEFLILFQKQRCRLHHFPFALVIVFHLEGNLLFNSMIAGDKIFAFTGTKDSTKKYRIG